MTDDALRTALTRHLVDELFFGDPDASLKPDGDLFDQGLDSMAIHRLVVFMERSFRVRVPDSEVIADNFRTLDALVALVRRRS